MEGVVKAVLRLILCATLGACSTTKSLPHRATWELYSIQGVYSQLQCPGQHAETMEIDNITFFLGCYGDTKQDSDTFSCNNDGLCSRSLPGAAGH